MCWGCWGYQCPPGTHLRFTFCAQVAGAGSLAGGGLHAPTSALRPRTELLQVGKGWGREGEGKKKGRGRRSGKRSASGGVVNPQLLGPI